MIETKQSNKDNVPCPRCEGLMSPEWCVNLNYDAGEMEILTWRCLQCGELIDPVILENRRNPSPMPNRKQPRPLPYSLKGIHKTTELNKEPASDNGTH